MQNYYILFKDYDQLKIIETSIFDEEVEEVLCELMTQFHSMVSSPLIFYGEVVQIQKEQEYYTVTLEQFLRETQEEIEYSCYTEDEAEYCQSLVNRLKFK